MWVSRVDPSVCLQEETTPNVGPDDDNLVTARGQPQRNNGRNSSNSGESHRNGKGHAAIPSKTPESTGGSFHRRNYKEGPKPASPNQFRKKEGLGSYQSFLRTVLV